MGTNTEELAAIRRVAERMVGLELLVLFGSRARGNTHRGSDWDFAYLGTTGLDANRLNAELALALRTDRVDVADLAEAGGLLRFRAARDGVPCMNHGKARSETSGSRPSGFGVMPARSSKTVTTHF